MRNRRDRDGVTHAKTPEAGYPMPRWRRRLVSLWIVFNGVAIACGSSLPRSQQTAWQRFFGPYLVWTRLLQSWQLFTPTPRQQGKYYKVEITFANGDRQTWRRPYPPNWDFFPRHLCYHFQKWDLAAEYFERPGIGPLLWRDLAHYLAVRYHDDANPPVAMSLVRSEAEIPPPRPTGYAGVEHDPGQLAWQDKVLFTSQLAGDRPR
jgi:hypothetical protein